MSLEPGRVLLVTASVDPTATPSLRRGWTSNSAAPSSTLVIGPLPAGKALADLCGRVHDALTASGVYQWKHAAVVERDTHTVLTVWTLEGGAVMTAKQRRALCQRVGRGLSLKLTSPNSVLVDAGRDIVTGWWVPSQPQAIQPEQRFTRVTRPADALPLTVPLVGRVVPLVADETLEWALAAGGDASRDAAVLALVAKDRLVCDGGAWWAWTGVSWRRCDSAWVSDVVVRHLLVPQYRALADTAASRLGPQRVSWARRQTSPPKGHAPSPEFVRWSQVLTRAERHVVVLGAAGSALARRVVQAAAVLPELRRDGFFMAGESASDSLLAVSDGVVDLSAVPARRVATCPSDRLVGSLWSVSVAELTVHVLPPEVSWAQMMLGSALTARAPPVLLVFHADARAPGVSGANAVRHLHERMAAVFGGDAAPWLHRMQVPRGHVRVAEVAAGVRCVLLEPTPMAQPLTLDAAWIEELIVGAQRVGATCIAFACGDVECEHAVESMGARAARHWVRVVPVRGDVGEEDAGEWVRWLVAGAAAWLNGAAKPPMPGAVGEWTNRLLPRDVRGRQATIDEFALPAMV